MDKPKVILITGGSSGIGLETATQLMKKGIKVYAASRNPFRTFPTPQIADASGGMIIPVRMDVNNEEDISSVLAQIQQENGSLDAVICNAGNGIAGSIEETSTDEVKYQFETNFFGAVKVIQACLPVFRKQGHGRIIATSSVAAMVPIPFQAFYSAGKSALSIFMQALAIEVKRFNIQCCTILPGDTKTEFTATRKYTRLSQEPDSAYAQKMKKSVGKMEKDELNGMKASFVARKIVKQLTKRRMKAMVIPGIQYKLICGVINLIPMRLRLWIIGILY